MSETHAEITPSDETKLVRASSEEAMAQARAETRGVWVLGLAAFLTALLVGALILFVKESTSVNQVGLQAFLGL